MSEEKKQTKKDEQIINAIKTVKKASKVKPNYKKKYNDSVSKAIKQVKEKQKLQELRKKKGFKK